MCVVVCVVVECCCAELTLHHRSYTVKEPVAVIDINCTFWGDILIIFRHATPIYGYGGTSANIL